MKAPTAFGMLLARSENQFGLALITSLAWVATCDGHYDAREQQFIQSIAADQLTSDEIDIAVRAATDANPRDLQLVCEILRSFDSERRHLFVDLAVGVAVSDGKLTVSENHVIRFVADLMGLTRGDLDQMFLNHTGRSTPEPSDLGSADWWAARDSSSDKRSRSRHRRSSTQNASIEAYAILGVSPDASQEDIRLAYRRLAKIHHPDKYESLGPEAVSAANETFKRIQAAYSAVKEA